MRKLWKVELSLCRVKAFGILLLFAERKVKPQQRRLRPQIRLLKSWVRRVRLPQRPSPSEPSLPQAAYRVYFLILASQHCL